MMRIGLRMGEGTGWFDGRKEGSARDLQMHFLPLMWILLISFCWPRKDRAMFRLTSAVAPSSPSEMVNGEFQSDALRSSVHSLNLTYAMMLLLLS